VIVGVSVGGGGSVAVLVAVAVGGSGVGRGSVASSVGVRVGCTGAACSPPAPARIARMIKMMAAAIMPPAMGRQGSVGRLSSS
jgi:hypothetical protein